MDCSIFQIGDLAKTQDNTTVRVAQIQETPFVMSIRYPIENEEFQYQYDINGVTLDNSPLGDIIEKIAN